MTWGDKMDWLRLAFAGGLLAFSTLTVVKAPGLWGWKLAILAGEFGYLAVLLPLILAGFLLFGGLDRNAIAWLALLLCLGSVVLLLKPVFQSRAIARTLPQNMDTVLGASSRVQSEPFAFSGLFQLGGPKAAVKTFPFAHIGTPDALSLDFYEPTASTEGPALTPCVIVIHGGGWDRGDRSEIASFNHWIASLGYAVAAIDYRLAPGAQWPVQKGDVLAAIAYLKSHASQLRIDPNQLVLFGRSAGGQIASAVGHTAGDPSIRGVIAFYAPHDMLFAWRFGKPDDALNSLQLLRQLLGGPPDEHRETYMSASAYFNISPSGAPPTLLVHGVLDKLVWVAQSRRLKTRLEEAGGTVFLLELPWATHALEFNPHGPSGQLARYTVERFLQATFAAPE